MDLMGLVIYFQVLIGVGIAINESLKSWKKNQRRVAR